MQQASAPPAAAYANQAPTSYANPAPAGYSNPAPEGYHPNPVPRTYPNPYVISSPIDAYPNPAPTAYANPASTAYANPGTIGYTNPAVAIISPHFCSPNPVDLAVVRKVLTITDGNFAVTDVNGNIVFKVKGAHLSLHERRVLLDAAGYPILTLRKKLMSAHDRWQVFRGDSTETRDLIFSAKRSSMVQLKTKLDVFLAQNVAENAPDFKVKGSWFERSCVIYAGNSSTIVAQMHKKHTVTSVLFGKDNFTVTVYPGIDYAFIVALIVILDEINITDNQN